MNHTVVVYAIYLGITVPLTLWVARTLHRHGEVFLNDVFDENGPLASAVNHLLVVGFYLINLGFVLLFMTNHAQLVTAQQVMSELAIRVGAVAVVLGIIHFVNVLVFNAFRQRAIERRRMWPPASGVPGYGTPHGAPQQ